MKSDKICLDLIKRGLFKVDTHGKLTSKYAPSINGYGYQVIRPRMNGKVKELRVHRLVWIALNGIPKGRKSMIDHINRNKSDNDPSNLRLVDFRGNAANRRRYTGSNNPAAKLTPYKVRQIRLEYRRDSPSRCLSKTCQEAQRKPFSYSIYRNQKSMVRYSNSRLGLIGCLAALFALYFAINL
jgi:hypothetical protein